MSSQMISFNCTLKSFSGEFISSAINYNFLSHREFTSHGMLFGLSKQIHDLKIGEKKGFIVKADEAFGPHAPEKVIWFPRKKLPKNARTGDTVKILSKSGVTREYVILELKTDLVHLDGNHPLAGQDLCFEIEGLSNRQATDKEINAGKINSIRF